MPELRSVMSVREPNLPGWRVIGFVSSVWWRWYEWILEREGSD